MNVQETAAVLAYFGSAWPTFDVSDDTADVWLVELGDVDPEHSVTAMREVVRTSDFPPSISKFRDACVAVACAPRALLALPPVEDDEQRGIAKDVRLAFVRACRKSLEMGKAGASGDEIAAAFERARPKRFVSMPSVTYPCSCGEGQGWIEHKDGSVSPCEQCRPQQHARWRSSLARS